ncbi:amidohydrolase family protein [Streptomyces sp. NPDC090088]|uniref:amidohydrolase family protein n=1 Tax=Streptomyces sp. NPDC090088 TaxID=3365944 RepID=UPI0037FFB227
MTTNVGGEQQIKVIDCDTHIIEPYDLWTSQVPQKWRDLVPRVVWNEKEQQDVWTMPGEPLVAAAAGPAMAGYREFPPSRPPRLKDADPTTWNVDLRLKMMDEYGIHTQVLYPNVGGFGGARFLNIPEAELRLQCVRIYNDWLTEWASAAPDRFILNAAVPYWDVQESVKEIRRCHAAGHRGIIFSSHPEKNGQPHLGDKHWDPLWATCQELGMPVNFHIGGGGLGDFGSNLAGYHPGVAYSIDTVLLFLSNADAVVNTIMGGICDRFPNLNFVSVESGIGWFPFLLEVMDWQWMNCGLKRDFPKRMMPSEYFKRQFFTCFWFERGTIRSTVDALGADRILFETDFPHPTSQSPGPASHAVEPQQYIDEALTSVLTPAETKAILHDNAAALYNWTT